jgi:hypothetical protein
MAHLFVTLAPPRGCGTVLALYRKLCGRLCGLIDKLDSRSYCYDKWYNNSYDYRAYQSDHKVCVTNGFCARKKENWSRGPTVDELCAGTCAYRPRLYGDPGPTKVQVLPRTIKRHHHLMDPP